MTILNNGRLVTTNRTKVDFKNDSTICFISFNIDGQCYEYKNTYETRFLNKNYSKDFIKTVKEASTQNIFDLLNDLSYLGFINEEKKINLLKK